MIKYLRFRLFWFGFEWGVWFNIQLFEVSIDPASWAHSLIGICVQRNWMDRPDKVLIIRVSFLFLSREFSTGEKEGFR